MYPKDKRGGRSILSRVISSPRVILSRREGGAREVSQAPRTRRGGSRHHGASFRLAGQARSNVNIVAIRRGRRARGLAWSCGPPHSERRFVSCTAEIITGSGARPVRRAWPVLTAGRSHPAR